MCSSPPGTPKGLSLPRRTHKPPAWAAAPLWRAASHCSDCKLRASLKHLVLRLSSGAAEDSQGDLNNEQTNRRIHNPIPGRHVALASFGWRHLRHPDTLCRASVTQLSYFFFQLVEIPPVPGTLPYGCRGPLLWGTSCSTHTPLCFGDRPGLCTRGPLNVLVPFPSSQEL